MSSKAARLHRQAANRKKRCKVPRAERIRREAERRRAAAQRLRRQTERRRAAAERRRKREAEQRKEALYRCGRLVAATTVGAATFTFAAATNTGGIAHTFGLYPEASQAYGLVWSTGSDRPDYPHTPEQDLTEYPVFYAASTTSTSVRVTQFTKPWDSWEWTRE